MLGSQRHGTGPRPKASPATVTRAEMGKRCLRPLMGTLIPARGTAASTPCSHRGEAWREFTMGYHSLVLSAAEVTSPREQSPKGSSRAGSWSSLVA